MMNSIKNTVPMMYRYLLVDADSFIQSFFLSKMQSTGSWQDRFLSYVYRVKSEYCIEKCHVYIIWETENHPKRLQLLPTYRANSVQMEKRFFIERDILKETIKELNYYKQATATHESCDAIYSMVKKLPVDREVLILSRNFLLTQLISSSFHQLRQLNESPIDRQYFIDMHGFEPEHHRLHMALTGRSSRGIPGVKGIGTKTASLVLRNQLNAFYAVLANDEKTVSQAMADSTKKISNALGSAWTRRDELVMSYRLCGLFDDGYTKL